MTYLPKAGIAELEIQSVIGNGCITRNSGVTVRRDVFYTVHEDNVGRGVFFLPGPCRGYITKISCHQKRALRQQLEK